MSNREDLRRDFRPMKGRPQMDCHFKVDGVVCIISYSEKDGISAKFKGKVSIDDLSDRFVDKYHEYRTILVREVGEMHHSGRLHS
jgi:hypothetical protein